MAWEAMQLIRDANRQSFWAVTNTEHRPPRSFDDPAGVHFVPRWGSAALLELATQAPAVDLLPIHVEVRDVSRLPLSEEHAREVSDRLVEAVRAGDLEAALDALEGDRGPYIVFAVELRSADGAKLHVGRYGGFEVTDEEPVGALLNAAKRILSIS